MMLGVGESGYFSLKFHGEKITLAGRGASGWADSLAPSRTSSSATWECAAQLSWLHACWGRRRAGPSHRGFELAAGGAAGSSHGLCAKLLTLNSVCVSDGSHLGIDGTQSLLHAGMLWPLEPCRREAGDRRITRHQRPGLTPRACQGRCGGPCPAPPAVLVCDRVEEGAAVCHAGTRPRVFSLFSLARVCSGHPGRGSAASAEPTVLMPTAVGRPVPATLMGQCHTVMSLGDRRASFLCWETWDWAADPACGCRSRSAWAVASTEQLSCRRDAGRAPSHAQPPCACRVWNLRASRGQGPGGTRCLEAPSRLLVSPGGFIFCWFCSVFPVVP